MRSGARRVAGDGGGAVVELAVALPLLVMLLFGIYQVGRGYHAKVELTSAVREGARAAALGRSDAAVTAAVVAASPGLSPAPTVLVAQDCDGAGATDARVQVSYVMAYSIPFVSQGTWTITEEGVMRCSL